MKDIKIYHEMSNADFLEVIESVGFKSYKEEQVTKALKNTMYMVKVEVDGKLAGIGRVVGDYSIVCCLSDICVKPEFQKKGIGLIIVKELKKTNYNVTILIGPNFKFKTELDTINSGQFQIVQNVPSLIQYFYNFDFAITGGGVTCCEANATGLPCYIIANARHEENTGRFMEKIGGSLYLGAFGNWDLKSIQSINELDISTMSQKGIENFDTKAINRIFSIIKEEWESYEK